MTRQDFVCRESRLRLGIVFFGMAAAGVAPWILAGGSSEWIAYVFVGIFSLIWGLATLVFFFSFYHSFHAANWLVRYNPYSRSLRIKFRTFDNDRLPEADEVIVELLPQEIAWMQKIVETRLVPGDGEKAAHRENSVFLDIKPLQSDLSELKSRLEEERKRKAPDWGAKNNYCPVRVVDGAIRIEWRSNWTGITPGVDRAMKALASGIEVRPAGARQIDLSASTKDRAEQESRILYLAERGQMIQAVTLVRQLYGYSLTEARQFVEELCGKARA